MLSTIHEEKEPEAEEMIPTKRMKKNARNEETKKRVSKKKAKKRDPALISFLTTYHETTWTAKYSCNFANENDDDENEICEKVNLTSIAINRRQRIIIKLKLLTLQVVDMNNQEDVSRFCYATYQLI